MSNSMIEAELLKASGLQKKKKEDRQDYLTRLMRAVAKVDDPVWEDLSPEAKAWNNVAATSYKEGTEIEDFPDLAEPEPEEPKVERVAPIKGPEKAAGSHKNGHTNGKANHVEPKPAHRARAAAQEPVEDEPLLRGRRSGPVVKKASACHVIKKLVVRKPSISVDDLSAKLTAHGMKVTLVTIATLRSSTRDTLRVLNEEGLGSYKL